MKKVIPSLITLLFLSFISCDEKDDIYDISLIRGHWQLVNYDNNGYQCIYNFTTKSDRTYSWGILYTYYISNTGGNVKDDLSYDYYVSDPVNTKGNETIELYDKRYEHLDDYYKYYVTYRIVNLSEKHMTLVSLDQNNPETLRFIRRSDLD